MLRLYFTVYPSSRHNTDTVTFTMCTAIQLFCAVQTWRQTLSVELSGEVARVARLVKVVRVVNIDMVGRIARIGKDCRAGCQS